MPERSDVWTAVDGHQHFWDPARVPLPWLRPEHAPIAGAFEPVDLEPLLARAGIAQTILVQSACSDEDTDAMFTRAREHDWIAAVVAWVPLVSPARAADRLDELADQPKLRGVRHLIHQEEDPRWILRAQVLESLSLLEARGLILELPAVFPRHLGDVPELARMFPRLSIVIDHLGKPPPAHSGLFANWAAELEAAAGHANVAAKISGLDMGGGDVRPAVETAIAAFGADRLLCGSDWPVSLLGAGYARVWDATRHWVGTDPQLLGGTARRLYRLAPVMEGAQVGAH